MGKVAVVSGAVSLEIKARIEEAGYTLAVPGHPIQYGAGEEEVVVLVFVDCEVPDLLVLDNHRKKLGEAMNEILEWLKEKDLSSEDLDDLVMDTALWEASNANNNGLSGQVEFLVNQGWSLKAVMQRFDNED
jgi:hypothetical protein